MYMYISFRVPCHRDKILQLLLKLVSDLCPDGDHVPDTPGEDTGGGILVQNMWFSVCEFKQVQYSGVDGGMLWVLEHPLYA